MFLNITNHPAAGDVPWSEEQIAAAEAIGGPVVDLEFPEVPPDASSKEVLDVALATVSTVLELGPKAALVQGEFTLTAALVAKLEALGIPCYAATTRRHIEIVPDGKGGSIKKAQFHFVGFRRYAFL